MNEAMGCAVKRHSSPRAKHSGGAHFNGRKLPLGLVQRALQQETQAGRGEVYRGYVAALAVRPTHRIKRQTRTKNREPTARASLFLYA